MMSMWPLWFSYSWQIVWDSISTPPCRTSSFVTVMEIKRAPQEKPEENIVEHTIYSTDGTRLCIH